MIVIEDNVEVCRHFFAKKLNAEKRKKLYCSRDSLFLSPHHFSLRIIAREESS